MSDRLPTRAHWRPASEPPDVPEGETMPVIVVRGALLASTRAFGAYYLNKYPLEGSESDEIAWEGGPLTGFYLLREDPSFDELWESIDAQCWAPMPAPPTPEREAQGFATEPSGIDVATTITGQLKAMSRDDRLDFFSGLFSEFCRHCGLDDPGCQCWNDE